MQAERDKHYGHLCLVLCLFSLYSTCLVAEVLPGLWPAVMKPP